MKFQLWFLISILTFPGYGQDIKTCNRKLKETFAKFEFYTTQKGKNDFAYDSINKCNEDFEKLLLKCTAKYPETLNFDFKDLKKNGLEISTSKNGSFRIYSWDTETGGTMRGFRNVFQFKSNKKVFSQKLLSDVDEYGESSYSYEIIDQIISKKKTFYIVKCISIGSSAVSSHKIKIFSIDNGKLNDNAKLIKTKSGIKNELSYDIDFSSSNNQNPDSVDREYAWLKYDEKNKIIILPLITEEGKLTKKKIMYQFKGEYFEKI
ncbi:MAG: hypothetical protein V4548_14120 [Bacteroidota bacterium]